MSLSFMSNSNSHVSSKSVIRVRYRPAAVQPEMSIAQENVSLSLAKRVKPEEEDPYGLSANKGVNHDAPIFLASHTQIRRIEVSVASDEEAYRKVHYPTIHERIEIQKEWAKVQLQETRIAQERENLKRLLESTPATDEVEEVETPREGPVIEEEEPEEENETNPDSAAFAASILAIKERKLLANRKTSQFHEQKTPYEIKKLAYRFYFGVLGKSDKNLSIVLPWLVIGRRETSQNMQLLIKLGITHILNATNDLPNSFNNHFIYHRVAVKDNLEADIGSKFNSAVNFIKRVEDVKGRLLVHCTAGASRAPTIVLAFLVFIKKIPLVDAYKFLCTVRPVVMPNKHFLFQLAMLEAQLGLGCSVYFHHEWRFYEFNTFRAEGLEARKSIGIYNTVVQLYTRERNDEDLLS